MYLKIFLYFLLTVNHWSHSHAEAALRRTPKIYNALITTDENLTSSRAYPVIQPTIHETGLSHYPYNPYGFFHPSVVRFGQPIAPGLMPQEQLPYPLSHTQLPGRIAPPSNAQAVNYFNGHPFGITSQVTPSKVEIKSEDEAPNKTQQPALEEIQNGQQPVIPPKGLRPDTQSAQYVPIEGAHLQKMPNEKLPIALNEYGLPPALIPLPQYPSDQNTHSNPYNLHPYAFNQFPVLPAYYDPITGLQEQYLPPYRYAGSPPILPATVVKATTPASNSEKEEVEDVNVTDASTDETTTPDFEIIKNSSKSKNSEVPDVPPPPIPSGANTRQDA